MVTVSVIMCAFNSALTIKESVESILNQTFTDFELIIIDDGSTDHTTDILNSINDHRVKIIVQENQGPSISRYNAIKVSEGGYIAILDSDDISHSTRLQKQVDFLNENSDFVLVGSNADVVDKYGNYIYTSDLPLDWQEIRVRFPDAPFYHSSVMYRKRAYCDCGGYHALNKLYIFEDSVLINKMKGFGMMANIKDPLIKYRLMPNAASTKSGKEALLLNKICREVIAENGFSEKSLKMLDEIRRKTNPSERQRLYYLHLAKKYLLNNHQPGKSRENLFSALKIKPFSMTAIKLFILSIIPKGTLLKIYHINKS